VLVVGNLSVLQTAAFTMGFGIKEPRNISGEHVPGTATLYDLRGDAIDQGTGSRAGLKRALGQNSDIILVPQPSDSPNDPLVSLSCRVHLKPPYLTELGRIGRDGRRIRVFSPSVCPSAWPEPLGQFFLL
jgi:hypothetical protein